MLLLDLHLSELRHVIALGNAECGTSFPADVSDLWAEERATGGSAGAEHVPAVASPPFMSLVGERESLRPVAWIDPIPERPFRSAVRLPDGTWSCRLARGNSSTDEAPFCRQ